MRARSSRDRRHAGNMRQRLDADPCAVRSGGGRPGEGPAARESPPRSAPASQDLYASQSRRVSPLGALSPRPAPGVAHELEQQPFGHAWRMLMRPGLCLCAEQRFSVVLLGSSKLVDALTWGFEETLSLCLDFTNGPLRRQ